MRRYEVNAPCPELARVLAKAMLELAEGEEAVIASRWEYVAADLERAAGMAGLAVVEKRRTGGLVEVVVRRVGRGTLDNFKAISASANSQ